MLQKGDRFKVLSKSVGMKRGSLLPKVGSIVEFEKYKGERIMLCHKVIGDRVDSGRWHFLESDLEPCGNKITCQEWAYTDRGRKLSIAKLKVHKACSDRLAALACNLITYDVKYTSPMKTIPINLLVEFTSETDKLWLVKHGLIEKVDKDIKCGTTLLIKQFGKEHRVVLIQTGPDRYQLLSIKRWNRWNDKILISDRDTFSIADLEKAFKVELSVLPNWVVVATSKEELPF